MCVKITKAVFLWMCGMAAVGAAEIAPVPVPPSPYLPVIYRFADALIEHGRDVYGPEQTGFFLGTIERASMSNRPPWSAETVAGYELGRKGHTAANPQHDQNLFRLLYTLSELSSRPKYRDAANVELKWLLTTESSNAVQLLTRHDASWDVVRDKMAIDRETLFFKKEPAWYRPWMLWEQCFAIDPEASARVTTELVEQKPKAAGKRETGFYVRTYAAAYRYTTNSQYLKALEAYMTTANQAEGGAAHAISLAVDAEGAAHDVPEPLAVRLRELASRIDERFCSVRHKLATQAGFSTDMAEDAPVTTHWGKPWTTTARIGMMCVSRYENTGNVAYRDLIHAAADAYFDTDPSKVEQVWPITVGHAISLQLAAWRSTAQQRYLDRARYFGDYALKAFFDAPLPRSDTKGDQYRSIAGTDTLALALVELHLNILGITAVRCPPNTIDR